MIDSTNPFAAPEAPIGEPRPKPAPPRSFLHALRAGAWMGLRWTTFIIGPLALLMLLIGVGTTFYGMTTGRLRPSLFDVQTRAMLLGPIGFYLVCCGWGALIGGVLGLAAHLFRIVLKRLNH